MWKFIKAEDQRRGWILEFNFYGINGSFFIIEVDANTYVLNYDKGEFGLLSDGQKESTNGGGST